MLDDLDETLRQLLIAEIPVKNGEVEISFDQPRREWSGRLSRPTVNLFLYDVRENNILRQYQWERLPGGYSKDEQARLKRTPFRVDCLYMLTTWAAVPEDEHHLLARSMLALFRFPILPEDRLVSSLRNPHFPIQTQLASHDRLTNPAEVWASLDNEMRPSVSYIVTLALDPWAEISCPLVRTVNLQTGQAAGIPQRTGVTEDSHLEMTWGGVGGTIRNKSQPEMPLEGIKVAIKDTKRIVTTDQQGRFILGMLPPGKYILVAWPVKGKPKEKVITVPVKEGDYDMEL